MKHSRCWDNNSMKEKPHSTESIWRIIITLELDWSISYLNKTYFPDLTSFSCISINDNLHYLYEEFLKSV